MTDASKGVIGPGSYQSTLIHKRNDPKYTMGARTSPNGDKLNSPGPDTYNLPQKVIENQGKTFGLKLKGGFGEGNINPGPGTYI